MTTLSKCLTLVLVTHNWYSDTERHQKVIYSNQIGQVFVSMPIKTFRLTYCTGAQLKGVEFEK